MDYDILIIEENGYRRCRKRLRKNNIKTGYHTKDNFGGIMIISQIYLMQRYLMENRY